MREIIDRNTTRSEITAIPLLERSKSQETREALVLENYNPRQIVAENRDILYRLQETPFRRIGQKLVKGDLLTFEEAFLGMTFVVCATNKGIFQELKPDIQKAHGLIDVRQGTLLGPAQTFLTAMAQKEAVEHLSADEIAGMVAASMMDINLRFKFSPYILETGGMGGDKGFVVNGEKKKVINASTLSALVLSSIGVPILKHGSFANTSATGSTEAVEALGIDIYQSSLKEIKKLFEEANFYFSDAHIAKTIHDLSHSPFMRHETINHIIGPMTPPVDRNSKLHKIIGVNEGAHPSLIGKAYQILHDRGYQNIGNVLVVSGLNEEFNLENIENLTSVREFMMLDEVSPYATLLGIVRQGKYVGCFVVRPEDFGVTIPAHEIQLVNTQQELLAANGDALKGLGKANTDYLALNAAIGLFAAEYMDREDSIGEDGLNKIYLKECFLRARQEITSGNAIRHLEKVKRISKGVKNE